MSEIQIHHTLDISQFSAVNDPGTKARYFLLLGSILQEAGISQSVRPNHGPKLEFLAVMSKELRDRVAEIFENSFWV
ncbi:MAG: hypothetical protein V2A63_03860 [Patescibacteria group bacterium]